MEDDNSVSCPIVNWNVEVTWRYVWAPSSDLVTPQLDKVVTVITQSPSEEYGIFMFTHPINISRKSSKWANWPLNMTMLRSSPKGPPGPTRHLHVAITCKLEHGEKSYPDLDSTRPLSDLIQWNLNASSRTSEPKYPIQKPENLCLSWTDRLVGQ